MRSRAPMRPLGPGVTRRTLGTQGLLRAAQQKPADRRHGEKSERGHGGPADRSAENDKHHRHQHTAERGPPDHVARGLGGRRRRGLRPRGGGVVVRSYGHVSSLVTGVAVVTGVTASTTGDP